MERHWRSSSATSSGNGRFAREASVFSGVIVQGVAMFGKDDQLATMAVGIEHLRMILQQPGELFPFLVRSTATNCQGLCFKPPQDFDFGLKFSDRPSYRRLIDDGFFGLLDRMALGPALLDRVALTGQVRDGRPRAGPPQPESCWRCISVSLRRLNSEQKLKIWSPHIGCGATTRSAAYAGQVVHNRASLRLAPLTQLL